MFNKLFNKNKNKKKEENEEYTPKALSFIVGSFLILLYLSTYSFYGRLFADIIAFIYPAYKSFQALNYRTGGSSQRKKLLTYWVVLAFFYVFESISKTPENFKFYYICRSMVTLWLYSPKTRGAEIIYNNIIRVVLKHNEKSIDNTVRRLSRHFSK